jgi:hypothetical protein
MIACLTFTEPREDRGRMVRGASFVKRSTLPLSAACLVANGVREVLSRSLATELDVQLIESTIPGHAERELLVADATILRVRGRIGDGFVIVRPADARRLVALAFGESEAREGLPLSAIERVTLERVLVDIVPLCNSLCGTLGTVSREPVGSPCNDLTAYFEVRTLGRAPFAIGFGLTRDPERPVGECVSLEALADVELPGRVEVGVGSVAANAFARLTPAATLALDAPLAGNGVLYFGDVAFARGTCGVSGGRAALRIGPGAAG